METFRTLLYLALRYLASHEGRYVPVKAISTESYPEELRSIILESLHHRGLIELRDQGSANAEIKITAKGLTFLATSV